MKQIAKGGLCALVLFSSMSSAGVFIDIPEGDRTPPKMNIEEKAKVEEKKVAKSSIAEEFGEPVTGYGHQVPLEDLLDYLVPHDWDVRYSDEALKDRRVDWRARGESLEEVLQNIADTHDLTLDPQPKKGVLTVYGEQANTKRVELAGGPVIKPSRECDPEKEMQYNVFAGEPLSTTLERWVECVDYTLVWQPGPHEGDQLMVGNHSLTGDFKSVTEEFFDILRGNRSKFDGQLHRNNLLRVFTVAEQK